MPTLVAWVRVLLEELIESTTTTQHLLVVDHLHGEMAACSLMTAVIAKGVRNQQEDAAVDRDEPRAEFQADSRETAARIILNASRN